MNNAQQMNRSTPIKLRGLGRHFPSRVVGNEELEHRMGLEPGWIERKTGVQRRRWAGDDDSTSSLAARACEQALERAGLKLEDISLIVNASGTPQRAIPDGAPLLQREMGIGSSGIPCMSIHTTCLSFVTALETCAALLQTGRYENILVFSSEIPSRGLDFEHPEAASIFGDGAAAAVLSIPPEGEASALHSYRMETYGEGADLTTLNIGTENYPYHPETDPKNALFQMQGGAVYRLAQKRASGFFERMMPSALLADAKAVVPHQTTMMGIASLRKHGIDMSRVVIILPEYGNCVAASVPMALFEAVETGQLQRGDVFVLIGTGAGLSIAGAALTF